MIDGVQIPQRWRWARFGDVAEVASDLVDPTLTPNAIHIAPNHIESRTGKLLPFRTVAEDGVKSPKQRFWPGQILYSKIRPYLAKAALATFEGLCSADMYPVTAKIDAKFLLHWILTPWFTGETARNQGRTILPKINRTALDRLPVPVAPRNEQRRIVAKIEELFSDLDAGVAALERAKANLKRYRAAVLKAAVDGSLTAEWRAKHPDVEPASKLLERILVERRRKWEADQLAKFKATGKEPPKNWKAKYVEPSPPDVTELPNLPKSWCWGSVNQICAVRSGQTPSQIKDYIQKSGDVPWFKVGDMNREGNQTWMWKALDFLTASDAEAVGLHVHPSGTIIFPKRGGAIATNKKRLLAFPAAYDLNTMGLIAPDGVQQYVWVWFQGIDLNRLSDGSNVPQINHHDIEPLPLPLPPHHEQTEIVVEVAEKLSQIEATNIAIDHGLLRAARLRQSILKQAFEGKLVPQDPRDEPASVLLDRIKSESQPHKTNGRPAKMRPRKKTKQEAT